MIRRTPICLILALMVGACSDSDPGPTIITDLEQLRVVKVSGDQSSPVPESAPSATIYATAGASLQLLDGDGYTPEPLVARVEATGVASRGTGPGVIIPPGTLVHWQIPEGAGRIYGQTTATDDSAYVINRWAPGTRAGTYQATAGRILADGTITDDATWDLVVEPGEPVQIGWQRPDGLGIEVAPGTTLDVSEFAPHSLDAHRNEITPAMLRAMQGLPVSWEWTDPSSDLEPISGEGWDTAVPDFESAGFVYVPPNADPDIWSPPGYRAYLTITIAGIESPPQVFRWDPHS